MQLQQMIYLGFLKPNWINKNIISDYPLYPDATSRLFVNRENETLKEQTPPILPQ